MKMRSMALASCAAIAIGAAAGFAYPAQSAVTHHHHRHVAKSNETSQEREATKALNQQQLQTPGSTANVQASAGASDTQANGGSQTMAESDISMQGASDKNSSGSNAQPSAAERAAARTGNEIDKAVGPDRPVTNTDLRQAVSLTQVSNPKATLSTAEIKNREGQALGTVKAVDTDSAGNVRDVKADVGGFLGVGEREVSLDARNLVYLKDRNLIVTDMTKPQIQNLPAVSKSSY